MTASRLVVVGDVVLDRDVTGEVTRICPDAPVPVLEERSSIARPGGAGLASLLAAMDGADVTLVAALADDAPAAQLRALLEAAGVALVDVGHRGSTVEKVRLRAGSQSLLRLDRGVPGTIVGRDLVAAAEAIAESDGVLVSDYGQGLAGWGPVRTLLDARPRRVPLVWDPHPRGVAPVDSVTIATPNQMEVAALVGGSPSDVATISRRASEALTQWPVEMLAVTLGEAGALLARRGHAPLVVPAPVVASGDTCGAGDRFAVALALAMASGRLPSDSVERAVLDASRFVANGGAASVALPTPVALLDLGAPAPGPDAGGVTVATGGCFDVLHAGHVALLESARRLGDRLVVLLNSDRSVRRLKGPDRPVQGQADRRAILLALEAVDDVIVFDEDTPIEALGRVRPRIWVKGGDYTAADLPEAAVLGGWGCETVIVPYLSGRSTTRILEDARRAP